MGVLAKPLAVSGNIASAVLLLSVDLLVSAASALARAVTRAMDRCCGSGQNTAWNPAQWHDQRYATDPIYVVPPNGNKSGFGELDVEATMQKSTFPIKPDALVTMAKDVISSEFGTAEGADGSCLADDFQFVAPIVGPLSKAEFLRAFGSFKLKEAVPDIADNSWFQVDPLEPNRVWFFSRATGTHTGILHFGAGLPATGRQIRLPPQAQSMLFNEQGKCYTLTVGYCMDKRIGNTAGLGGVFGIVKAVGKPLPFPEAQRLYTPSLRFEGFQRIAKAVEGLGYDPTTRRRLPAQD